MRERWSRYEQTPGVYFAGFGNYVKIGWSGRVGQRLRELEGGTPETLTLYALMVGAEMDLERAYHRRFKSLQIRNEWFRLDGDLKAFLTDGTAQPRTRSKALLAVVK